MTVLGVWLKQLIMVVFLAILADFLLPTKAMQKYVRVVMSLAIIAMMIQPIMPVFQKNFASGLANQLTREIFGSTANAASSSVPSYTEFQNQLQSEQETEGKVLLTVRLRQGIEEACACDVSDVEITGLADGFVDSVTVATPQAANGTIRQRIREFVAEQLGLSQDAVHIVAHAQGGDSAGS